MCKKVREINNLYMLASSAVYLLSLHNIDDCRLWTQLFVVLQVAVNALGAASVAARKFSTTSSAAASGMSGSSVVVSAVALM